MTTIHIQVEQSHTRNLPYEIQYGHVNQTEQEEPERTEIEGQQTIPLDDRQRVATELIANLLGYLVGTAELLAQTGHQALELRSSGLLFLSVADVRLLEITLIPGCRGVHLVVDLLLALRIVELSTFLTLQEEEVYLDVVVGQALLTSNAHEA